ncbi:MAG TPA: PHP domain-containing protein [Methylomirabilota bacterium]|nr:PHP domain-containing protein [Methylomirabilota bacterium]
MGGAVDLHAHTTASDGGLAPRELVRLAVRHGVRVLAVTDHDSTDGLAEALAEAAAHPPLTVVAGLEINCDVTGGEVHVLGYCVDYEAEWFQAFLRAQRAERVARVHRIAERLAELGLPIDPVEVLALVKEGSAGRPHVAQVMVKRGYVKSVREAFDRYLHAGGPANVPRHRLTPADAVALIRRARGVPVLAHPGLADRDDMIPELVAAGLMGIEAYYNEHSAAQTAHYVTLCRRLGLVATGGSDYHGEHTGRSNPPGTPPIPMAVWEALRAKAAQARAA